MLLGIDAGQTVIKAALFDLTGREIAVARGLSQIFVVLRIMPGTLCIRRSGLYVHRTQIYIS